MFLVKCPDCGRCGCECGKLPYTLTVTLSGLTNKHATQRVIPVQPCMLAAVSCFGEDGFAKIVSPGGCYPGFFNSYCDGNQDDRGPIESVVVVEGGTCYAKLGRVAPTVSASAATPGEAATLTVSLDEVTLGCDGSEDATLTPAISHWKVGSISVTGGTKYNDESPVLFKFKVGDTFETLPVATMTASEGIPTEVLLTEAGFMYRESKDAAPYVASVSLEPAGGGCVQDGFGEQISAVVDEDPYSATFGKLISASIEDGGDDWLAWRWGFRCMEPLNEQEIILRAADPHKLVTAELDACYGSGACIEAVLVSERAQPTIRFSAALGCGATFTPTVVEFTTDDGKKAWRLESLTATGGAGYVNNAFLVVFFDEEHIPLDCGLQTPVRPVATIAVGAGGAITSATVVVQGEFYLQPEYDGTPSAISEVVVVSPGTGYAKRGRIEPTLGLFVIEDDEPVELIGFAVAYAQGQDDCGLDFWSIDSVEPGEYGPLANGNSITILVQPEGLTVQQRAASLRLQRDDEGVLSVQVITGGEYYTESDSVPAYVAEHSVFIRQISPSNGSGAEIEVTIDDEPLSGSFGSVTAASVVNGGSGYTLAGGPRNCLYRGPGPCELSLRRDGDGDALPIVLSLSPATQDSSYAVLASLHGEQDEPLQECEDVSGELSELFGLPDSEVTATVTTGGVWSECSRLCYACPDFRLLCFSASATDWDGNTDTIECKDFFREKHSAAGAFENLAGGYSVSVTCAGGRIAVTASASPNEEYDENCGLCTSAFAEEVIDCTNSEDWYLTTVTLTLEFPNPEECVECPPLGVVEVTIGVPPC